MSRRARTDNNIQSTGPSLPNIDQQIGKLLSGPIGDQMSPMAIYGLDDNVLWSNTSYARLLSSVVEHNLLTDILHPSRWLDHARLIAEGHVWRDGAIDINGKDHLLQAHFAPLLDGQGQLTGISSLLHLTPNSTKIARDLMRMQERLADVVRLASDWIWETDANLNLTFLSERVSKVMGYYPAELAGKPLHGLAVNRRAENTLLKRFETWSPFRDHVFESADKNGQLRLLLISAVPIFDLETGAHLGFRGTANDITELTERERNLLAAKEAAEQANRAKTHFLAHMSHELRTPLNSIIGFSEMMRLQTHGALGSPEYISYAGDIHDSANHLLAVINDILGLTSVEAGTLVLHDSEATLEMIAQPVLQAVRSKAVSAGLTLSVDLPPNLPHLMIDQRVTRQIISNVLSNAIKFTPKGGTVELRARNEADGSISLTITDTGIGISEETLEHIFMPFFQAEGGTTRKFEGTGLGLALSKRLADLLGGNLSISSKRGVGATVTLTLPARRAIRSDPTPA
jgi:PAS domain S-box-containing protein